MDSLFAGYPGLLGLIDQHGCLCLGVMVVRVREVMARLWVGVCVCLALSLP